MDNYKHSYLNRDEAGRRKFMTAFLIVFDVRMNWNMRLKGKGLSLVSSSED